MQEPQSPEQKARILIHDEGLGVPTPEAIQARARELALIAGRSGRDYTEADYQQAKRELSGAALEPMDVEQAVAETDHLREVPGTRGHQARTYGAADESTVSQELIEEGLDEALHDEMLEASKRGLRDAS